MCSLQCVHRIEWRFGVCGRIVIMIIRVCLVVWFLQKTHIHNSLFYYFVWNEDKNGCDIWASWSWSQTGSIYHHISHHLDYYKAFGLGHFPTMNLFKKNQLSKVARVRKNHNLYVSAKATVRKRKDDKKANKKMKRCVCSKYIYAYTNKQLMIIT